MKKLKNKLFAFCLAPLFAAAPLVAEEAKAPQKQEVVSEAQVEELSSLIAKRLELAKELAVYKWNNKQPIDDQAKEKEFLAKIEEKAAAKGLDVNVAKSFFTSQMEAEKSIHIQEFEKWVEDGVHKHEKAVSVDELNAKMQECDNQILDVLSKKSADLVDAKKKENLRIMISKALKESHFSRESIDSATGF